MLNAEEYTVESVGADAGLAPETIAGRHAKRSNREIGIAECGGLEHGGFLRYLDGEMAEWFKAHAWKA